MKQGEGARGWSGGAFPHGLGSPVPKKESLRYSQYSDSRKSKDDLGNVMSTVLYTSLLE
jgi:hypothetical protein